MERRRAADTALDLILYAPLGLALAAREVVPQLAARGRAEFRNQTQTACMVGRLATREGCRQAERLVGQWLPRSKVGPGAERESTASRSAPQSGSSAPEPETTTSPTRSAPSPSSEALAGRRDAAEGLAVAGYDTLSASQVVARLEGLTSDELEAIRSYEAAGRARRTVLHRISQLHDTAV